MADISGLVIGLIPLWMTACSAHSMFIEAVNDAPAEIKALAEEVKGYQFFLRLRKIRSSLTASWFGQVQKRRSSRKRATVLEKVQSVEGEKDGDV